MAKKWTKKCDACANFLFFRNKPIAILTFSLPVPSSVGFFPAAMNMVPGHFQRKIEEQIEPKETCSCLIPLLLVVLIKQLQILVTTLVNCVLIVIKFPYLCQYLATETLNARNKFLMLLCSEVKAISVGDNFNNKQCVMVIIVYGQTTMKWPSPLM